MNIELVGTSASSSRGTQEVHHMSTNTLLNDQQGKLLRLAKTYRTLTAAGYSARRALEEIGTGFALDRDELQALIKLLANK